MVSYISKSLQHKVFQCSLKKSLLLFQEHELLCRLNGELAFVQEVCSRSLKKIAEKAL